MNLNYLNPKEFWCLLYKLKENKLKNKIFIEKTWIDHIQNFLCRETQIQHSRVNTESVSP